MSTTTTNKGIKFTEEEIKGLKEVRGKFTEISYKLGQIEIQKANLDIEKAKLMNKLQELTQNETKIAEDLKNKYGHGTIDIESGEFVPAT